MFIDSIQKLDVSTLDRRQIEAAFNVSLSKGASEYDAGVEAVQAFHKGLLDDLNEMRALAGEPPVKYCAKKAPFDYNGLTLSREPNAVESLIDLKGMVDAYDGEKSKINRILLGIRNDLIAQATAAASKLTAGDVYTLTLTPPATANKKLRKELEAAIQIGRDQVAKDLEAQKRGA